MVKRLISGCKGITCTFRRERRRGRCQAPRRGGLAILSLIPFFFFNHLLGAENLLLITVDTIRADHLSCYGYQSNSTPHIDAWAKRGVRFTHAYAEVPLTLPSHCTIMTGTFPFYHGVRDNSGFVLREENQTLAEILHEEGFETAAFIGAYVLASRFGIAQGFDLYDEINSFPKGVVSGSDVRRPAEAVLERFLEWLKQINQKPFFAWVHFYDPHSPWPTSYDGEISRVDRAIGTIDRTLKSLGLMEKTHVIFTGDHGESLGEHGESGHGYFIYDATLRVPLIFLPARSITAVKRVIASPVSLMNLLPTALQLLKISGTGKLQGQSLLRAVLGREFVARPLYAESLLPELQFGWGRLQSLRQGRYKVIDVPRPEFYDLEQDPGEKTNLFEARKSLAAGYLQALRELLGKYSRPKASETLSPSAVDAETAERLAALGYTSLSPPASTGEKKGSLDPKDKIEIFEEYGRLVSELRESPSEATFRNTARLRRRDPTLRGVHYLEGIAHERLKQLSRARDSYLEALKESPGNNAARANLANVYVRLGQVDRAGAAYEEVLRREPGDYRSRNNYAILRYRQTRDASEALRQLRRVVSEAPGYASGWMSLGVVSAESGKLEDSEDAFRQVIRLDPASPKAYRLLAAILRQQGKMEEAKALMAQAARLAVRPQH